MWVIYHGKEVYIEQSRILDAAAETVSFFGDDGSIKYAIRRDPVTAEAAAAGSNKAITVAAIAAAAAAAYLLLK